MRIQHNIMAMNAYRNYNNNTSALSKNLEKLSSGYKINRAGDDAAGLAISEKMRAQITGLQTAQKNVKDGISLVKTGEGAMQEVQDMLNRMVELATQSANGTYDNEVDRDNLQQEVDRLKEEIDRIADSANFNGIKLLDGSLSEGGEVAIETTGLTTTTTAGTASSSATANAIATGNDVKALTEGQKLTVSLASSSGKSYNIELVKKGDTLVDSSTGKAYNLTAGAPTDGEVDAALKGAIESATGGEFTATVAAGKLTITSTATGANAPSITAMSAAKNGTAVDLGAITNTAAKAETINVTSPTAATGAANAKANIFSINGQKFVLANSDTVSKDVQAAVGDDVTVLVGANIGAVANQLAQKTGLNITADTNNIKIATSSGKGLTLQIGDTSETFNQMTVSIKDVHVNALGISNISVATQDAAKSSVKSIKDAINTVSSIRGTLGATQNRLEHTQNNLSVMTENIQDAESTIRDTDVADEMMAYTKNNILVQSAQAMLAQANQVPQGVLQLLQ